MYFKRRLSKKVEPRITANKNNSFFFTFITKTKIKFVKNTLVVYPEKRAPYIACSYLTTCQRGQTEHAKKGEFPRKNALSICLQNRGKIKPRQNKQKK